MHIRIGSNSVAVHKTCKIRGGVSDHEVATVMLIFLVSLMHVLILDTTDKKLINTPEIDIAYAGSF